MGARLEPARLALVVLFTAVVASCGGAGGDLEDAGLPRGPRGGRLVFDAAMLDDPADAAVVPSRDAALVPRDTGARPDSGRRTCTGVATTCGAIGPVGCTSQRGCRIDGDCSGVSRSCYSTYTSSGCYSQDGCYWDSSRRECSGSARYCSSYYERSSCSGQDGCRWEDSCDGYPTGCSLLSEWECELQRGCLLR